MLENGCVEQATKIHLTTITRYIFQSLEASNVSLGGWAINLGVRRDPSRRYAQRTSRTPASSAQAISSFFSADVAQSRRTP